jgi:Ca2+-binding RTX toxin-like protein
VTNTLFGDAASLSGFAKGSDDTLIAGTAAPGSTVSNDMWGDGQLSDLAQGGADLFLFKDAGSMTVGTNNTIEDFSQRQQDKIEFSGVAGVQSFADLVIAQSGADTMITAGADQVTLHNFTNPLTANDFLFV